MSGSTSAALCCADKVDLGQAQEPTWTVAASVMDSKCTVKRWRGVKQEVLQFLVWHDGRMRRAHVRTTGRHLCWQHTAASCASSTPHKVVTQQLLSMLLQPYGSPDVFAWDAG